MARQGRNKAAGYDPREIQENIVETPLNEEMSKSFLEYAYSVIYARALPDARDGLKPVQRRIIYQMGQMNLTPDRPYMKSARAVGEVMGKLHPHGDSSIYEAMVRLAQPFAMRLPLVDGHGNFGSLDDGPAASRYTEARLAPAALGMNADIDQDTVDFSPNYDNKLKEPTVLPSAIPNLLVNGASGIAVGMATNMITHNLGEVVAAAKYLMAHPDTDLDGLMRYVPGPDLPGGGVIVGRDGIRQAYAGGRGSFVTRAVTHVENVTARKKAIVVTELPYMVGPERVLERIGEGVKNHHLEGISSAIDLTDRHNGTRIVIEIKTGFDPGKVLGKLFKYTPLEDSFTINNVALVNGRPHTMGLKELLEVWVEHRRTVIKRRSEFRKTKAEERLHLVEGMLLALVDIDEVIQVIRSSQNADEAKTRLMAIFDLDQLQAQYILDLRLRRLTKMSRIELESERDDLRHQLEELEGILASSTELDRVVIQEMDKAADEWGSPRRTVILDQEPSGGLAPVTAQEDEETAKRLAAATRVLAATGEPGKSSVETKASLQLEDQPCTVMMSATGLLARSTPGAMDVWLGRSNTDKRTTDDQILAIFSTTTRSSYGLVTSAGRLVTAQVADLPLISASTTLSLTGGVSGKELLKETTSTDPLPGEDAVTAVDLNDPTPLAIGTYMGTVKRWNREAPTTMDSWPIIDLKSGDRVVFAAPCDNKDRLVFLSSDANLLTFQGDKVRPQGRNAGGMAGIRLNEGCHLSTFAVIPAGKVAWTYEEEDGSGLSSQSGAVVLTVAGDSKALPGTDNGAAKVTPLEMFPVKGRGTGGVRSQRFLRGQDTILLAHIGPWPLRASTASGKPVDLPPVDMRRDASGQELGSPIAYVA